MDKYGEILKKRIKEMGHTQEEFAELAGISYGTLKKYLSGDSEYNRTNLIKIANALECSYDYLLGESPSAKREYRDISEQLRLSDGAIEKLLAYAERYDKDFYSQMYIKTFDAMVKTDGLIMSMADYLITSHYISETEKLMSEAFLFSLEQQFNIPRFMINDASGLNREHLCLVHLVSCIKDAKHLITEDILEELKKLQPIELTRKRVDEYTSQKGN